VVFTSTGCAVLNIDAIFMDMTVLLALYAAEWLFNVIGDVNKVIHYVDAFCNVPPWKQLTTS
jgi:hypothetical protein